MIGIYLVWARLAEAAGLPPDEPTERFTSADLGEG